MTTVNILEDSNNPTKYIIISSQAGTSESVITTRVIVGNSADNRIDLIEVSKIPGEKGDKGDKGDVGPAGQDGVVFDVLPLISGGTNNTSFTTDKIIYYDGTKLSSSLLDVNSIQNDVISNIYAGAGLTKTQDGSTVTINTNPGNGLTIVGENQLGVDTDVVITKTTLNLSDTSFYQGILPIAYGGTNNSFFGLNGLIYYDGEKIATYPVPTGQVVHSGHIISVEAGSGLIGGGDIVLPNGSVVIKIQNSDDIVVFDDHIELSQIVASGTYTKVSVNDKGRVISGSNLTFADVVAAIGGTPWTSSNDGDGSGLDADLLDGQEGSYYRNAGSLTGTISTDVLPDTIGAGWAPKVEFNAKGLIIDSGILSYLDITQGLGYVPFDKSGGSILGDVEIFGDLIAESAFFTNNVLTVGDDANTNDIRAIKFRYNDFPAKYAVLGYYPAEDVFRISAANETSSGTILTLERADAKYVALTGNQAISGIKQFLNDIILDARLIINSPYGDLSPFSVGGNTTLVQFLNSDLLDGEHKSYYRNAGNLTGTLNPYVIIPHIQERGEVYYSDETNPDAGYKEYIPMFHVPTTGHPMVLRPTYIYQTGYLVYMEDVSVSIGFNTLDDLTINSLLVGTDNTSHADATNSMAVGDSNFISGVNSLALNFNSSAFKDNTIALGRYGETWLDDQIAIGGFKNFNTDRDGNKIKDAHAQVSYVPLKYHGEASSWVSALSFDLPDNKTLEYSVELLFTKQINTGVASFTITPGIVKNYGYRDRARNYQAFKKATIATHHEVIENYNNSQERIYSLPLGLTIAGDTTSRNTTLEVTAPPYQYNPLDIEGYADPIIVRNKSDFQTRLKATRGTLDLYNPYGDNPYRHQYLVKLEPYDISPYNTGAPVNLGRNIYHYTECLYYRESGAPRGVIKFPNHGIVPNIPTEANVFVGTGNIQLLARKDTVIDLLLPETIDHSGTYRGLYRQQNSSGILIYKTYLHKNLVGNLSGSLDFNVYRVSGSLSNQNFLLTPPRSIDDDAESYYSDLVDNISLNFSVTGLSLSNRNWSELDSETRPLSITFENVASWTNYGITNITGHINPHLGLLEINLGATYPLTGPSIYLYTTYDEYSYPTDVYFYPDYYLDDLNATLKVSPHNFYHTINENFEYIDRNTLGFSQKQLCYVNGDELRLIDYPTNLGNRFNSNLPYFIDQLVLNSGDTIVIGDSASSTTITGISIEDFNSPVYLLANSYAATTTSVSLATPISGVGISHHKARSYVSGSYTYSKSSNGDYGQTYSLTDTMPLIVVPIIDCIPDPPYETCLYTVPTGHEFVFSWNSGIDNNTSYYDGQSWTFLGGSHRVAVSSIAIAEEDTYIDIPPFVFPINSLTYNNTGLGIASGYFDAFDFRINNLCLGRGPYSIRCSGYEDSLNSAAVPALFASGNTYRYYLPAHTGGVVSYRFLTSGNNNESYHISDSFRSQLQNVTPSFNHYGNTVFRFIDLGLTSSKTWRGSVDIVGSTNLNFTLNFEDLALDENVISQLVQGNFVSDSGDIPIAYATGYIYPDNTGSWYNYNLSGLSISSSGEASIRLMAQIDYDYINFSGVATTGKFNILGSNHSIIDRGLSVVNIYPKIDITLQSATGSNTGVFGMSLNNKQPYQKLTINSASDIDYLRYLASAGYYYGSDYSENIDNNLNISFSMLDGNNNAVLSGIWHPNTLANKHLYDKPYSKIYNTTNSSFEIAVLSGYIPEELPNSGPIILSLPKIYDFDPDDNDLAKHIENRLSVNFNSVENILHNGIYSILEEYTDPYSIYFYDWPRSFVTGSDAGTGIINYNNIGYNIINDKFSIWGTNFNGDIILHPWRDVPTFISESPGTCESGRLCIKFSGIPNYFQANDNFWVDIIPNIYPQSTDLISITGYFVTGITGVNDSEIYLQCPNAVNSGVVSGMNVFGNYILSNSYIRSISGNNIIRLNQSTSATEGIFGPIGSQTYPIQFSFNRETTEQNTETNNLREAWRSFISGDYEIYRDEVAPTVVSILTRIPPFYYRSTHPYYNAWNTPQQTRGVNVWKNSGYTGISMMITGIENIQTDKNPNYAYRYLNVAPSLRIDPYITGYSTVDNTFINITGTQSNYRFALDETNKYLCATNIDGLYRPTTTSGILSSQLLFTAAGDWTTNTNKTERTTIVCKDIDDFSLLGIDLFYGNNIRHSISSANFSSSIFTETNLPQNSGITVRFGLIGGAGIERYPPKILVTGIESPYKVSQIYNHGLSTGLLSYNQQITPFSNTWYIDLYIDALNNISSFDFQITDILGETTTGVVINSNPRIPEPYISNFTTGVYAINSATPWVVSFDIENVSQNADIDVSGGSNGSLQIISSGIAYNTYLNKWQAYAFGNGVPVNAEYTNIPIGVTGDATVVYTGALYISDTDIAFAPRITNLPALTKVFNTDGAPAVLYFNYQRPFNSTTNPSIQVTNAPANATVATTLITDSALSAYFQATNKQLYRINITNVGPTGYTIGLTTSLNSVIDTANANIIVYDSFGVLSLTVPDPSVYVNRNWSLNISTQGGGGPNYMPHIQLFDAPSQYGTGNTSYDYNNMGWDITLTGVYDDLGRYPVTTGLYNIGLYITDITSRGVFAEADITYKCLPDFDNLQELYAVKNKAYPVNLNVKNFCSDSFVLSNNNFNISMTLPTSQTLFYNKYNPWINLYELRYSGDPPIEKWDARIVLSQIDQELSANDIYSSQPSLDVQVKGLDTDRISVVGMLQMKEIEVVSTDYPPLEIQNVVPEEDETTEYTQGDVWRVSFDVVGGLANANFPPTILLSGTPSICSGYYPDEDPDGPSCMQTRQFVNDTFWRFAFTGGQVCDTGLYNVSIKAFDITGEDIAYTNLLYTPLQDPSPQISTVIESTNLYPNCLPFSGHIRIVSPERPNPCFYATGISGWHLFGELPTGLEFVKEPPGAWELPYGSVLQITGLDPEFYTGTGGISFTGIPTRFPENNIYDSFVFSVTGINLKDAEVTVSLNTAGIVSVAQNPIGATLYFPSSGYYPAPYKQAGETDNKIRPLAQTVYLPYPGTGAMLCRSSLSTNKCPPYITGTYSLKEFSVTGLVTASINDQTIFNITGAYGYEPDTLTIWQSGNELDTSEFTDDTSPTFVLSYPAAIGDTIIYSGQAATGSILSIDLGSNLSVSSSNVYVVFEENLEHPYNDIYQLVDIVQDYNYNYELATWEYSATGDLRKLCDKSDIFAGISPGEGFVRMMPFSTTSKNIPNDFDLLSNPRMDLGCNTCLLGDGELQVVVNENNQRSIKLIGTMRPSMVFNITGDYYPEVQYDTYNPCGNLANINLVSGVAINTLAHFAQAEQEEICYSNCYESGITYLSGIILPKPVLELTDPTDYIYNGQTVALSLRCSFGDTTEKRNNATNYRQLTAKYSIQHMNSGLYWNSSTSQFVNNEVFLDQQTSPNPQNPLSIGYTAPTLSSGAIYRILLERESDEFPTLNPNSYQYLNAEYYWIHRANSEAGAATNLTYPGFMPIAYGSGLFVPTGQYFSIPLQILGGSGLTVNEPPDITSYLSLSNSTSEVLDSLGNSHRIGTELGSFVEPGKWNISVTGDIIDMSNYLLDYNLNVEIAEHIDAPFGKTTNNIIPVTFIKLPLELNVISNNFNPTLTYGTKWQISFNVIGGNRPPRYYENTDAWISGQAPTIEINGDICNYDLVSSSYNIGTSTWSFSLASRNLIYTNQTLNLMYMDKMGYSTSTTFNVTVESP